MNESDPREPASLLALQEAGVTYEVDREHAMPNILHEKGWSWPSIDPLTRLVVAASAFVVTDNPKVRGHRLPQEFAEDYQRVFWRVSRDETALRLDQENRPSLQRRVLANVQQQALVGELIWTADEIINLSDLEHLAHTPAVFGGTVTRRQLLIEQLDARNQQGTASTLRSLALLAMSKFKETV
jgi:hypothetical protein